MNKIELLLICLQILRFSASFKPLRIVSSHSELFDLDWMNYMLSVCICMQFFLKIHRVQNLFDAI